MSDRAEIKRQIDWLESTVPQSSAYKVHEAYTIYVGGDRCNVQILDQGTDDEYRFIVHARNEETGEDSLNSNGEATPRRALEEFHWEDVVRSVRGDR